MTSEPTLKSDPPLAIETRGLTKYYGRRKVVDHLDLRIPYGAVYGLLGRNGAGKSTIIKILMGMVQASHGQAMLMGQDVATLDPTARQRIAYLAEGHPLYGWMTVGEMVNFARAFNPRWNQALVDQVLDHFELPRKAKLRRLSRGQHAQVSLTLAIAPDPELLVLDDPTLGLDTIVRRELLESLIQLIQRRGRTILLSYHILGDVERVADRIGVLVDGVLRVDCPTDVFKQRVRKVVLSFGRQPAALASFDGLVGQRVVGSRLELVIVGYNTEHQRRLADLQPLSIEVVELNLEDAFIEYTRGSRPPLPLFAEDASDGQGARVQGAA